MVAHYLCRNCIASAILCTRCLCIGVLDTPSLQLKCTVGIMIKHTMKYILLRQFFSLLSLRLHVISKWGSELLFNLIIAKFTFSIEVFQNYFTFFFSFQQQQEQPFHACLLAKDCILMKFHALSGNIYDFHLFLLRLKSNCFVEFIFCICRLCNCMKTMTLPISMEIFFFKTIGIEMRFPSMIQPQVKHALVITFQFQFCSSFWWY